MRSRTGTGDVALARPSEASRRRGPNKAQRRGLSDNDRAKRLNFVETVFKLQIIRARPGRFAPFPIAQR